MYRPNCALAMVALSGTGPPSRAKMAKRTTGVYEVTVLARPARSRAPSAVVGHQTVEGRIARASVSRQAVLQHHASPSCRFRHGACTTCMGTAVATGRAEAAPASVTRRRQLIAWPSRLAGVQAWWSRAACVSVARGFAVPRKKADRGDLPLGVGWPGSAQHNVTGLTEHVNCLVRRWGRNQRQAGRLVGSHLHLHRHRSCWWSLAPCVVGRRARRSATLPLKPAPLRTTCQGACVSVRPPRCRSPGPLDLLNHAAVGCRCAARGDGHGLPPAVHRRRHWRGALMPDRGRLVGTGAGVPPAAASRRACTATPGPRCCFAAP